MRPPGICLAPRMRVLVGSGHVERPRRQGMLSVMDRRLRAWHFWLANALAIGWFAGMTWATQAAIPGVKFFRCPFGLCLGYYTPGELTATFTRIGKSGREFL